MTTGRASVIFGALIACTRRSRRTFSSIMVSNSDFGTVNTFITPKQTAPSGSLKKFYQPPGKASNNRFLLNVTKKNHVQVIDIKKKNPPPRHGLSGMDFLKKCPAGAPAPTGLPLETIPSVRLTTKECRDFELFFLMRRLNQPALGRRREAFRRTLLHRCRTRSTLRNGRFAALLRRGLNFFRFLAATTGQALEEARALLWRTRCLYRLSLLTKEGR